MKASEEPNRAKKQPTLFEQFLEELKPPEMLKTSKDRLTRTLQSQTNTRSQNVKPTAASAPKVLSIEVASNEL